MKTLHTCLQISALMLTTACSLQAQTFTVETAPPVVVNTFPLAGSVGVDPGLNEIRVTFSKAMSPGGYSVVQMSKDTSPELPGGISFTNENRTCVIPVRVQPGKGYVLWINDQTFKNFTDLNGRSAVPYLLSFSTGNPKGGNPPEGRQAAIAEVPPEAALSGPSAEFVPNLDPSQKAVLTWTDRQFRSLFDNRTFKGWTAEEKSQYEMKLIDALKGPKNQDYFQAINTLGAMRSTNALPALREIAYDRADKNNRDRWMAIRSLGLIGQKEDVPELVHLVYHGNPNTHWWAQIALVKITGRNFGSKWEDWGKWWNDQEAQPPYKPEIRRWWSGQAEPDQLAGSLAEGDKKFLESIGGPIP